MIVSLDYELEVDTEQCCQTLCKKIIDLSDKYEPEVYFSKKENKCKLQNNSVQVKVFDKINFFNTMCHSVGF